MTSIDLPATRSHREGRIGTAGDPHVAGPSRTTSAHTRTIPDTLSPRVAVGGITIRAGIQADRYDGSPSPPAARPRLALQARGQQTVPGTTCGNHRANYPRHLRASPGMVFAVQMHEPNRKAGCNPYLIPPYKRGATGSNPVAPTRAEQQRRCPTCGNAVRYRLLLSGWLRLFTADGDWLRPIRAQVGRPRRPTSSAPPLVRLGEVTTLRQRNLAACSAANPARSLPNG